LSDFDTLYFFKSSVLALMDNLICYDIIACFNRLPTDQIATAKPPDVCTYHQLRRGTFFYPGSIVGDKFQGQFDQPFKYKRLKK